MLTCKVELITLVGSYDSNEDMSSYWEDEDGNVISNDSTVDVTMSGFYTFYVVDELTGCVSSPDVVFVGLDIEEPLAFIYSDPDNVLNCKIDLINLSYDEEDDVVYEWNFNEQTSSSSIFQIDTTGMVVLTAIDTVTGCIAIDTVLIQELEEFPIVSILPFQTLNCNDTEVIINASNSIPVETSTFEWFDIEGNIIESGSLLTVIDSGQYVLVMTDTISGCVNSDTLEVEANFSVPDITVSADFVLDCSTSATTLEATTNANGEFLWTTLDGQFTGPANEGTLDVISAGVYVVEFIDGESFCNIFDTVLVSEEINLLSLDNWSIEDETCFEEENGALLIGDINGGDLPYVITINDIVVSEEALYELVPGSYEVNVIDADGCSKDTTFVISAAQAITISGPENIDIVLGDSGELDITTNIAVNEIDTIIWSPTTFLSCIDCLNNSTITTENITYVVTIIDVNGCEISTEIEVRVEDFPNIYSPNVFTPNGDGLNDNFTIFTNEVMLIQELVIFNRWGEKVFVNENFLSNDASLGWDGTFKGESVNPAVFAFYALVVLPDNAGIEKIVGDVTVVK